MDVKAVLLIAYSDQQKNIFVGNLIFLVMKKFNDGFGDNIIYANPSKLYTLSLGFSDIE